MHYHDAAIQHKKTVEINCHLQQFFRRLYVDAVKIYTHISYILGHGRNINNDELWHKFDLDEKLFNEELRLEMMIINWRWRYFFVISAIANLLK